MNRYFRKVIQLQSVYDEKTRNKKGQIAYYKFENRNKQCNINLFINDVVPLERDNYVFCLVYKDQDDFIIKELRTLLVKQNRIEDKLSFDENLGDKVICTLIVLKNEQNDIVFPDNIRWVGYHENFNLDRLYYISQKKLKDNSKNYNINKREEPNKNEELPLVEITEEIITEAIDEIKTEASGSIETEAMDEAKLKAAKEIKTETEEYEFVNWEKLDSTYDNKEIISDKIDENLYEVTEGIINKKYEEKGESEKEKLQDKTIEHTIEKINKEDNLVSSDSESDYKETNINEKSENSINNESDIRKDDFFNSQGNNQKDKKTLFDSIDSYKKSMEKERVSEFLKELFKSNQKIGPFVKTDEYIEWIQIDVSDLIYLPIDSWIYINNAFLMNCYRKYQHLILGLNRVDNEIMLGVPDVYYFKNSIIANLCGFYEFRSCKDNHPKAGEYGYWIVKSML